VNYKHLEVVRLLGWNSERHNKDGRAKDISIISVIKERCSRLPAFITTESRYQEARDRRRHGFKAYRADRQLRRADAKDSSIGRGNDISPCGGS